MVSPGANHHVSIVVRLLLSLSLVLARRSLHTRWERLLQLVGLVGVLEDKGVEALLASDLELGLRDTGALVLLYASSWNTHCQHVVLLSILCSRLSLSLSPILHPLFPPLFHILNWCFDIQRASFLRQISMKLLMSVTSRGMMAVRWAMCGWGEIGIFRRRWPRIQSSNTSKSKSAGTAVSADSRTRNLGTSLTTSLASFT